MSKHSVKLVQIGESLLIANDQAAERNRQALDAAAALTLNVMAAPGAGKTSLIVRTLEALRGRAHVGVIEGDIAGSIDTEKVLAAGARDAIQINTGGNCHLEANMVHRALGDLDLGRLDIVIVENVGNLVCPTHWALGEHLKLCLVGAAEGHDKPVKYPEMFVVSDVIILNKIDLIELVDFDRAFFIESVRALNPRAPIFEISCRTGQGIADWADWLLDQRHARFSSLPQAAYAQHWIERLFMCLPLIARVVAIKGDYAEVQLLEGEIVRANLALQPDVAMGQHVLLDRGLIIEVIAVDQVETMLAFYAELTDLWAEEDARSA